MKWKPMHGTLARFRSLRGGLTLTVGAASAACAGAAFAGPGGNSVGTSAASHGTSSLLVGVLLLLAGVVALLVRGICRFRESNKRLQESEERFRLLVENSLVATYLIGQDGIVRYANRAFCAMFGYQPDDLIGKTDFHTLVAPEDLPRVTEHFQNRLQGLEAPPRYESKGQHRTGEPFDIEILGCSGTLHGQSVAVGSILDISLRKRVEQLMLQEQLQREEMNRTLEQRIGEEVERSREKDRLMLQQSRFAAMGEMIANIAHQWRQPLNKLGIVLQRLQMEQEKGVLSARLMEERVGEGLELLLGLSRTIDDFRTFFRPDLDPAPFSVSGAVLTTVNFFEASCAEHGIKIQVEGESSLIYHGHVAHFRQALLNILGNARDALVEKRVPDPAIVVGLRDEERRSVLTVRDNAGGIDPEIIDKIFDPYFSTKGKGNRTGLGLYMAKSIIDQQLQGRLVASNVAQGAEFRIVL